MNEKITNLISMMKLKPGASEESLLEVQSHFGINFPKEYANFLLISNGAEGQVGSSYLVLWTTDDLKTLNTAYSVSEFVPGLLLIGSNGADTAYGIDTRSSDLIFVEVPFVGMDLKNIKVCGKDFISFLEGYLTAN